MTTLEKMTQANNGARVLTALYRGLNASVHQLPRNLLSMRKLVVQVMVGANKKALQYPKHGITAREIYDILTASGFRVTKQYLAITLHGLLQDKVVEVTGNGDGQGGRYIYALSYNVSAA